MGKNPGRTRVKGTGKKQKRWKKGQSCVTNPLVNKYRQEATRSRMFPVSQTSKSGLTADAIARHNEDIADEELDDVASVGGETYKTFLSGVTDCSQPAFEKVKRFWQSQASSQKEVCAILAAVTEVIREQGGSETETEYFGALMTAMETMTSEDSLTAVLFLLSLIMRRVPAPVLKKKFPEVSKTLSGLLAAHASGANTALVKSTISCLGNLLRVQDASVWGVPSTLNTYQGLLSFTTHSKPKVRKAAHKAVVAILKGSPFVIDAETPICHPAAQATSKFCIQQIEKHGGSGEATTTCHVLTLLQSILSAFPKSCLKETCETILKVMTLSNVIVSAVAMKALHSLFSVEASKLDLPPELNAKLINALYDFQPSINDSQPSQAWLTVMQSAHINLCANNESLCLNHLQRLFQVCMADLISEKGEVAVASANVMKSLLKECIGSVSDLAKYKDLIHKIYVHVEGGLSYRYHASWGLVLQVLSAFFQVWGKAGHLHMRKCLQTMCDLRGTHHFAFINEVDRCIGEAVRAMGPRVVLEAVPLDITGDEDNYDFPRSWLVPVIRDNVCNTELQFFNKYFLPLAAKLKIKSLELKQQGREVEAKTYDVLQAQIWSLLPGFCKSPTDVVPAFKGVAKVLGSALNDRKDVRQDILTGLRNIISSNLENEGNKAEISRFAKNFLPILFNIYTTEISGENRAVLAVLETIKVYLKITSTGLVDDLAARVTSKFSSGDSAESPALLDLMIALVPYAGYKKLSAMFEDVSKHFESPNHTLQKKAYRVLEEMCSSESEACSKFIDSHIKELEEKLVQSMATASSPSKSPRLRCLLHIVKQLSTDKEELLRAILPEVVLCTKEVNSKTRGTAFLLLSEIGHALMRVEDRTQQEAITAYLTMLAAGLAGSNQMIGATILAFTAIIYEFKDMMQGDILQQLVDSVHVLIRTNNREILRPALGLVKVICAIVNDTSLAQFVPSLVSLPLWEAAQTYEECMDRWILASLSWLTEKLCQRLEGIGSLNDANSRGLRAAIKSIFKQLLKKFGFEMISKMVPPKQLKMLQNVRKVHERSKRLRDARSQGEDEDGEEGALEALAPTKPKPESMEEILQDTDSEGEEEGDTDKRSKVKGKRSKKAAARGSTWLKEDDKDEPIDFLDPSVSKRVLATKPNKGSAATGGIKHDFKKLPDGRLVITEPSEEGVGEGSKPSPGGKKRKLELDDDLEEMMDEELSSRKKAKKKWEDIGSSDDEEEEGDYRYQAGGKGIHRALSEGQKKKAAGAEYKSKKAGGDITKKGEVDPYAYLPLSRQQINKRKKKQAAGVWKGVAKTGHRKGAAGTTAKPGQRNPKGHGGQNNKRHRKKR